VAQEQNVTNRLVFRSNGIAAIIRRMQNMDVLTVRAQKGDAEAFGEIYLFYYKKIYRYCSFNVTSNELAKDIAQETFLKAWRSLPRFSLKNGGTIQAFLFKIARNLIIDNARKKKPIQLEAYHEIESSENVEENILRQQHQTSVHVALAKLQDEEKQIVLLRYFEDMQTKEIASVLGIAEGALRVRMHRVLKKLKDLLPNYET
jgi:RNA polymerase sigma-70 factor (ECF subfamily)